MREDRANVTVDAVLGNPYQGRYGLARKALGDVGKDLELARRELRLFPPSGQHVRDFGTEDAFPRNDIPYCRD